MHKDKVMIGRDQRCVFVHSFITSISCFLFILTLQARAFITVYHSLHLAKFIARLFESIRVFTNNAPMFLAYTYTRNTRPFLKLALVSCLTLLFLLGFTFITGGYTNPDSTVYRYTHEYSQKYGSWLQSKLGMKYTTMEDEDGGEEGNDEGRRTFNIALTERAGHHDEVR